jgi:hypothetical protein
VEFCFSSCISFRRLWRPSVALFLTSGSLILKLHPKCISFRRPWRLSIFEGRLWRFYNIYFRWLGVYIAKWD